MAVAHVAQRANFANGGAVDPQVITLSNPTAITVGNHLILMLSLGSTTGTVSGITDSAGNTWAVHRSLASASHNKAFLASCKVANAYAAGGTITVDLGSGVSADGIVNEFSGLHATTWYVGGNATFTALTTWSSGVTDTAAAAGDLVYGGLTFHSDPTSFTMTAEAGTPTAWTALTSTQALSGFPVYGAYRVVDGAESPNFDGTVSPAKASLGFIGVFRTAGGAPPPSTARSFAVIAG